MSTHQLAAGPTMAIHVLGTDPPPALVAAYQSLIEATPHALVQHSWAWRDALHQSAPDAPVYLLATTVEGEALAALPACHVRGPWGDLLLSLPQAGAYGGLVLHPALEHAHAVGTAMVQAFLAEARHRGCALATLTTAPFSPADTVDVMRAALRPDFTRANFYQFMDLTRWPDRLMDASNPAKYVQRVRAATTRHALAVSFSADDATFASWVGVHEARMAALGATPLPRRFLHAIRATVLSQGMGFFVSVHHAGELLAGGLFVGRGEVLDGFLLASTLDGDRRLASSVLVVAAIERAQRDGYRWLNWQSCSSRDSGVYHFKRKWGSQEGTHHYLTRITGELGALRQRRPAEVRAAYPWRYVMPFEQLTPDPGEGAP